MAWRIIGRMTKHAHPPRAARLGLQTVVTIVAAHLLVCPAAADDDWHNWRGPNSNGIASGSLPADWTPNDLKLLWESPLGGGWSSPVVADGFVVVSDRKADRERLLAFDAASGQPKWTVENPIDFDPHAVGRRHGNGPKSTPVLRDGRAYSLGIAGWLQSVDVQSGEIRWSVHLPARFGERRSLPGGRAYVEGTESVIVPVGDGAGAPVPLFGYTGSLVLSGQRLICPVGGARGGTIVAFDIDTGEVVWQSLNENVSYSSPVVAKIGGLEQVVVMTGPNVRGLDVRDGAPLWSFPFQIEYDESIGTPAVAADHVMFTGSGRPFTALRVARDGGKWSAKSAWRSSTLSSYLSSALAFDGHVYGMNDGGEFACLRVADGHECWVGGRHGYYSTPVAIGEVLLALNEKGELLALRLTPDRYEEIAVRQLVEGESWTSPAIADGRLYVRSKTSLSCFDLAP